MRFFGLDPVFGVDCIYIYIHTQDAFIMGLSALRHLNAILVFQNELTKECDFCPQSQSCATYVILEIFLCSADPANLRVSVDDWGYAVVINVYRSSGNTLKTDDSFIFGFMGQHGSVNAVSNCMDAENKAAKYIKKYIHWVTFHLGKRPHCYSIIIYLVEWNFRTVMRKSHFDGQSAKPHISIAELQNFRSYFIYSERNKPAL